MPLSLSLPKSPKTCKIPTFLPSISCFSCSPSTVPRVCREELAIGIFQFHDMRGGKERLMEVSPESSSGERLVVRATTRVMFGCLGFCVTTSLEQAYLMKKMILGKLEWYLTISIPYTFLVLNMEASTPVDQEGMCKTFDPVSLGRCG
ncbi:hypothetical protein PHJA_002905800 [Phtheirospermum japonicum]|uniref:Uncharacterized protein n=1 Tax=Phtheirospermum japonicum TaxID=374723 RepID=A0A830D7C6_9LAMI|nr:hypothetical protein PHJA_002905800 [Phtheirospermum japonicum]